jgi:hypothetical protein
MVRRLGHLAGARFAGYAPVDRSFLTAQRVLAFAVEWRGLRSPEGRRTSLRRLLFSDGTFRTDFGALEVDAMPLVVGYSAAGAGSTLSAQLSEHSWGAGPAGTQGERVLAEVFGPDHPSDLDHVWVRWAGKAGAEGAPTILNAQLKRGVKLSVAAAGSDIEPGARVEVDGVESFALMRNRARTKWVVGKRAMSTPGGRRVEEVWADGQAHTIVVINPSGLRSAPVSLAPLSPAGQFSQAPGRSSVYCRTWVILIPK